MRNVLSIDVHEGGKIRRLVDMQGGAHLMLPAVGETLWVLESPYTVLRKDWVLDTHTGAMRCRMDVKPGESK
jgi:hypothetical protein